ADGSWTSYGTISRVTQIEDVVGSYLDDTITGDNNANNIWGGAGNDTINGWRGADNLYGGTGNDTYIILETGGANVFEDADSGIDTVIIKGLSYTLGDNVENLTIVGFAGTLVGVGNDLDNVITGE